MTDKSHQQTPPAGRSAALASHVFVAHQRPLATLIGGSIFKFAYLPNRSPFPLYSVIVSFLSPFLTFSYSDCVLIKMF